MAKQKKHIFLSYCHDNASEAQHLHDDLVARGFDVWWDRDLVPGQDWRLEIRRAIESSFAVVVCFSKEAAARERSGMYPEFRDAIESYRQAAQGTIFLIPIRFSECPIPPLPIDGSRTLDHLQFLDLFPQPNWDLGLDQLGQSLHVAKDQQGAESQPELISDEVGRLSPSVSVEITLGADADVDGILEKIKRILGDSSEATVRRIRRG